MILGQDVYGPILNPAYITTSRNGYIYIINYSTNCAFIGTSNCWISSTTTADLFIFNYIPEGYYNFSKYHRQMSHSRKTRPPGIPNGRVIIRTRFLVQARIFI